MSNGRRPPHVKPPVTSPMATDLRGATDFWLAPVISDRILLRLSPSQLRRRRTEGLESSRQQRRRITQAKLARSR